MRIFAFIFWLLLVIIVVSFAAINSQFISVDFYYKKIEMYLPLLILCSVVLGAILGVLAMFPSYWRAKGHGRRMKSHAKRLERENDALKNVAGKE